MMDEKGGMSKKQLIAVVAFLLLSCLFRNNVIYGLVLFGFIALIAFRKHWKTIVLIGAGVLIGFLLFDKLLYGLFGIPDADSKEMLSVPIQQIGRAYRDYGDTFTEEELEEIDRYIGLDVIPYYNSHISDPIKTTFRSEEFDKDKKGFISLWLSIGKEHPDSYAIAYLSLYSPYWYFRSKSFDVYTSSPYVEVNISDDKDYVFERKGYLPFINNIYTRIANGTGTQLLSRSIPFWITVTMLFYALVMRRKKAVAIPLVCLCYLLTLFAGPLCIIRYTLPAYVCIPLMILSVVCASSKE